MSDVDDHLVGLLLGTEEDWPHAFEVLAQRLGVFTHAGNDHRMDTERVRITPFSLRDPARHDLVIDRLAHWYYHPREWLKKVALMDDVYLLNSPFTFQSMEKHAAYCAMIRLGLDVPETVLVPYKNPVDNVRWAYTADHYNEPFDLPEIAAELGYPLYMKPFDGGGWRGVSRIEGPDDLQAAYDASGEMLMHLQQAVDYDVFVRALAIGPETMVMKFRPERPMHERYEVAHDFLSAEAGRDAIAITRTVNAFFRWEFNSCEMLAAGDRLMPIDYANACPDVALTSLHYYFPWAMTALLRWSAFCLATDRRFDAHVSTPDWFAIADDPDRTSADRLAAYGELADRHFDTERYQEFCATSLPHVDELVREWVDSSDFDDLLVRTVRATYPDHEHERFLAHFRGLLDLWRHDHSPG
ncbi:ATP-grasp domain-containing protein [Salsipaludibacter albus]|uniref:ATP-grasp domain-containing protein n=1 Tax=Salsipaludibacter albus TaxID=2849650 RepID=UPI001EE410B2|nr:hypothetical protein [Salsipaludibacter albus]MBY5162482.1 hypothetical protein [Salsipaludibacter albus]